MSEKTIVRIENVFKFFGIKENLTEVLNGVSIDIKYRERLGILGASGAGKSTLLHIIGTLERPTSGSIFFDGEDITRMTNHKLAIFRNRMIGFVFQFHHLLPEFSALENVMIPAMINGIKKKESRGMAEEILNEVGLSHRLNHRPGELSGGEQQRVAIARALVMEPTILLADEPTGNLDTKTGEKIIDLLVRFNQEKGITEIIVTHNMQWAEKMTRNLHLKDGKIA